MEFRDQDIQNLDPKTRDGLNTLLQTLCGETISIGCTQCVHIERERPKVCHNCQGCMNWSVLQRRLNSKCLALEGLNDILLLVDQFPLSQGFFDFFFAEGRDCITFDQLKKGIARFEGFAMLRYGNVRFAYRKFYKLKRAQIEDDLEPFTHTAKEIVSRSRKRQHVTPLPQQIDREKTWFLGYIARLAADRDIATYFAMAAVLGKEDEAKFLGEMTKDQKRLYVERKKQLEARSDWRQDFTDLSDVRKGIDDLRKNLIENRIKGWLNTSHYLASDFMDVYVATSMRERWEFEDVHTFVQKLFKRASLLPLKLRYFDPTQSHLDSRVDKGLVEALMLKRADCTVYMVQETDTFGKDSELATTLAQGKPVVAYVPIIEPEHQSELAYSRPLAYLLKRLNQLIGDDKIPEAKLSEVYKFLGSVSSFHPYYRLVGTEEQTFVERQRLNETKRRMCRILAEGERKLFDARAIALQEKHPLALQVQINSGVANGVLVVRSIGDCAELLHRLLTNSCKFSIDRKREKGVAALVETKSTCPFRVMTENATITNSFWSRYLTRA